MQADLLKRITINSGVCDGKPSVRNMRYPVSLILDLLSAGMTADELLLTIRLWKKKIYKLVYYMLPVFLKRKPFTKFLRDKVSC